MNLGELAYSVHIYAHLGEYDKTYLALRRQVGDTVRLDREDHRLAVLAWLNTWGCRQFKKKDHDLASRQLEGWYAQWGRHLVGPHLNIWQMSEAQRAAAARAHDALVQRTACKRGASKVRFGLTGASKILFALRPNAYLPWDEPIRKHLGAKVPDYGRFLKEASDLLGGLEHRCAKTKPTFSLARLPAIVDRPNSTCAKLIDEYFWVTITRRWRIPGPSVLAKWAEWMSE